MSRTMVRVTAALLIGGLLLMGCSKGSGKAETTTTLSAAEQKKATFCAAVVQLGVKVPAIFEKKVETDADVKPFQARVYVAVTVMETLSRNAPADIAGPVAQLRSAMQGLLGPTKNATTALEVQELIATKGKALVADTTFRQPLQQVISYVNLHCTG